ncbi:hypothetical protein ACUOFU_16890 [Microbacterium arabinogalactanolyticum]|uniref:hypothetical protein n=1 Tax=Microbacterium arabinogalactanolyticum TaxID=69365 RepID=UPI0040444EE5
MAISRPMVASIRGKVLIQLEGSDPVEVGEVEIPIYASTERPKYTRGRNTFDATRNAVKEQIEIGLAGGPIDVKRFQG